MRIDCDIHPGLEGTRASLLPYLDDHWREQVTSRGIDVGAKADVFRTMRRLAGEGLAILFSTSDLEEVMALSDRIAVMSNGKITKVIDRAEATEEMIVKAASEGHKSTREFA